MYEIKKTEYGFHVTMGGAYEENEIEKYITEKERLMAEFDGPYSVIVDLRTAIPPKFEDIEQLRESQERMKYSNLHKMAIIISSPVILGQAKQIGFMAGLESKTKYIDASRTENWEEEALKWISDKDINVNTL